jgi:hypothetical protein
MEIVLPPVKNCKSNKEKLKHDILTPIGLYFLADKYEIASLFRRTLGLVETALTTNRSLLNDNTIHTIVTAYYTCCARPQSGMGVAIATGLTYPPSWVISMAIDKLSPLVIAHGHFAADLIIARRRSGF